MKNIQIGKIEKKVDQLSNKIVKIESQVSKINESKDWDYQKVLSAIKYLYRYYDDMTKDKGIDIR